jgi:hypothetical protein
MTQSRSLVRAVWRRAATPSVAASENDRTFSAERMSGNLGVFECHYGSLFVLNGLPGTPTNVGALS